MSACTCYVHHVGPDNRCVCCLAILVSDSTAAEKALHVGGRYISQRCASRVVPSLGRALPYDGNLERAWISLNRYIENDGRFWVRAAFADATWKTYERDWYDLGLDEAQEIFEKVNGWLGRLPFPPDLDTLFALGFGFG